MGFTSEGDRYSSIGKTRFLPEIELNDAPIKSWLRHSLGMEIFNTKIGLSIVTVIGSSSLRDELPDYRAQGIGYDRQHLKNFGR